MSAREVLQSWKEIAAYLGRDVRTCRRWEEHLGLPIHRLNGSRRARVLAYKDEIDWWLETKLHERDSAASPGAPGLRAPPPRPPSCRSISPFRRWYALIAFTAFSVIAVLGWRTISNGRPRFVPSGSRPTLAVLPFVNGTGDEGLNYLRESLPDHLVRDLQRSSELLTVYSFDVVTDAVRKLGLEPGASLTSEDLAAVSARTGADWFLIGSLSRAGSKIRIDYELRGPRGRRTHQDGPPARDRGRDRGPRGPRRRRCPTGFRRSRPRPGPRLWRPVRCRPPASTKRPGRSSADIRSHLDPADLEKIIGLFDQAREADPGCPLAYIGLGDAFQHRFVYEGSGPEVLRLMEENYRRAYEMAPDRAETHVGLAWVHFFKRDNDQAYAFLKKAVTLDPSSLHVLTSRPGPSSGASGCWKGPPSTSRGSSRPGERRRTSSCSGPGPMSRWDFMSRRLTTSTR